MHLAGYHHIPGNLRMPYVAEYSVLKHLTAPSAVHLTACFSPDSHPRRLSVEASLQLSPHQRFKWIIYSAVFHVNIIHVKLNQL